MPGMLNAVSRMMWTKKARAEFVERTKNRAGMNTAFTVAVKLMGPSDGSGCLPPGESITHQTKWRSVKAKAIAEAIAYCDQRQIKITGFPVGFGY